ncbi:hypothetical protein ACQKMN_17010 [Ureibacillus composti]
MDLDIREDIKVNGEKLKELRNVIAWLEERHKDSKEIIVTINELKRQVNTLELQIGSWI